jgi:hypothetical protein
MSDFFDLPKVLTVVNLQWAVRLNPQKSFHFSHLPYIKDPFWFKRIQIQIDCILVQRVNGFQAIAGLVSHDIYTHQFMGGKVHKI